MQCPAEIAEVILPHPAEPGCSGFVHSAWQGADRSLRASNPITFIICQIFSRTIPQRSSHYYWNVERPEYIRQVGEPDQVWMDGRNSGDVWAIGSIRSTP